MYFRTKILGLALVFTSLTSFGAQVLKVSRSGSMILVSHEKYRNWEKDDDLCVVRKGKTVACGRIIKSAKKGAVLKIVTRTAKVKKGDWVVFTPITEDGVEDKPDVSQVPKLDDPSIKTGKRKTRKLTRREARRLKLMEERNSTKAKLYDEFIKDSDEVSKVLRYNISGGINAGFNHFFPMISFKSAVSPKFAIGFAPFFLSNSIENTKVSAIGAFVTADYFPNRMFEGIWGHFGPGIYAFTASQDNGSLGVTKQKDVSLALLATVGWREQLAVGVNAGIAAGLQFVFKTSIDLVEIEFKNFQPTITVDVGFAF